VMSGGRSLSLPTPATRPRFGIASLPTLLVQGELEHVRGIGGRVCLPPQLRSS
jgi:hypothetical protein